MTHTAENGLPASIRGGCADDCRVTWNGYHGPNRSIPGTSGSPGGVRRCEHGRIWLYERTAENRFYCQMDLWRRLSRVWNPVLYRRAVRALTTPIPPAEPCRQCGPGYRIGDEGCRHTPPAEPLDG